MKRIAATLLCTLAWVVAPAAQQQTAQPVVPQPAPAPVQTLQTFVADQDANNNRELLRRILQAYPPNVRRVIALDPSLLTNPTFMAPYPQLATYVAQHPDVLRNPAFYFGQFDENFDTDPVQMRLIGIWQDVLTGTMVVVILSAVATFIGWLIKTWIEHRRWVHVSKVQTEAHNKLLDRFSGHEELLAYIQTPSGRRFLEAAPAIEAAPRSVGAPVSRVLWSAQIGVVLLFAGGGLRVAATELATGVTEPLKLIGSLGIAVGAGFIVSAVAAYVLSRRFGLLEQRTNE